jgi:hypothetical protein
VTYTVPASIQRRFTTGFAVAATIATQLSATSAAAALPSSLASSVSGGIAFPASVPLVHRNLPLFRLTRTSAPTALVQTVLAAMKGAPLAMKGTQLIAQNAHGALSAYVDGVRGDAEVFPDLTAAPAASATLPKALLERRAGSVFRRADMIPQDATTAQLGNETPVLGAGHGRTGSTAAAAATASRHLFTYVNAVRYAAGLPVVGKGSQASVAIADDGSIRGLVRRWHTAAVAGTMAPTTTATQVVSAIDAQLEAFVNPHTQVTVNRIALAYYDGGANYLQPVYTFLATVHGGKLSDDHVVGYVPVGKLVEPIPSIGVTSGSAPQRAATPDVVAANSGHNIGDANGTTIQLGEYANDDGSMLDMADAYNNGYTANSPWWAPAISRTQWYWAQPWDYVGSSNSFANAVDIAYTNPHGDWWENSTDGNNAGIFSIDQIGTAGSPGYGAAAGGILSTWILDSCEVIPSAYDLAVTTGNGNNAFTPWFPVFAGLHRALGFRTEMLLGQDSMNWQIAYDQSQGADAVVAFFNDVAAIDFSGLYGTYYDTHLGWNVNYDRVSVMIDDRDNGESVYGTAPQSAAYQLDNYWMGD